MMAKSNLKPPLNIIRGVVVLASIIVFNHALAHADLPDLPFPSLFSTVTLPTALDRYALCGGGLVAALRSQTLAHRAGPGPDRRELQQDFRIARNARTCRLQHASLPGLLTRAPLQVNKAGIKATCE